MSATFKRHGSGQLRTGPSKRTAMFRGVVLAVLCGNLLAYAAYRAVQRSRPPPAPTAPELSTEESASGARSKTELALARAHRVAGLAALEDGDYALAVKEFSQALQQGEGTGDSKELLRIAKDLLDRHAGDKPAPTERPASDPAPEKPTEAKTLARRDPPKKEPAPRSKKKEDPKVRASSAAKLEAPPEPLPGMLVVTSSPSGLVVEVDGRRADLTPARIRVDAGPHTVALLQGDQRLFERKVEVEEDSVSSVDADLLDRLRPTPEPERADARPATSEPEDPSERSEEVAPAATRAVKPPPAEGTGDLHVSSLGVFGEVWINGRAYGPPPVLAKNIEAGEALVEIRVNGTPRRSKRVEIEAGKRGVVHIR